MAEDISGLSSGFYVGTDRDDSIIANDGDDFLAGHGDSGFINVDEQ